MQKKIYQLGGANYNFPENARQLQNYAIHNSKSELSGIDIENILLYIDILINKEFTKIVNIKETFDMRDKNNFIKYAHGVLDHQNDTLPHINFIRLTILKNSEEGYNILFNEFSRLIQSFQQFNFSRFREPTYYETNFGLLIKKLEDMIEKKKGIIQKIEVAITKKESKRTSLDDTFVEKKQKNSVGIQNLREKIEKINETISQAEANLIELHNNIQDMVVFHEKYQIIQGHTHNLGVEGTNVGDQTEEMIGMVMINIVEYINKQIQIYCHHHDIEGEVIPRCIYLKSVKNFISLVNNTANLKALYETDINIPFKEIDVEDLDFGKSIKSEIDGLLILKIESKLIILKIIEIKNNLNALYNDCRKYMRMLLSLAQFKDDIKNVYINELEMNIDQDSYQLIRRNPESNSFTNVLYIVNNSKKKCIQPDETVNTQYPNNHKKFANVCRPQVPYLCGKNTLMHQLYGPICRRSEADCNLNNRGAHRPQKTKGPLSDQWVYSAPDDEYEPKKCQDDLYFSFFSNPLNITTPFHTLEFIKDYYYDKSQPNENKIHEAYNEFMSDLEKIEKKKEKFTDSINLTNCIVYQYIN